MTAEKVDRVSRMLFVSLGFLFLAPIFAVAQVGGAGDSNNLFVGRWSGAGENSLYSADAVVIIFQANPQVDATTWSGSILMQLKAGGQPTRITLKGEHTGLSATGNLSYTDATGAPKVTTFEGKPVSLGSIELTFSSGEFGNVGIDLKRTTDIIGVWLFEDGNPMTVTMQADGSYVGTYRGTAASGHSGLSGILTGTFDSSGLWDGIITITEGNVLVTGRFQLQRTRQHPFGPAAEETLEGTITASSNLDPVVRTNPIKLVRGEG